MKVRMAAAEDYDAVVAVIDGWWGRQIRSSLPRLFFDHFWSTSLVAEDEDGLAGFLVGFVSPARPDVAYVHFVGVRPGRRRTGLARALYEEFAVDARRHGCHELRAITSPVNAVSIGFHERIGFTVSEPVADYDGPGRPMVVFRRRLG